MQKNKNKKGINIHTNTKTDLTFFLFESEKIPEIQTEKNIKKTK